MQTRIVFGPPGSGKTTRLLDLLQEELARGVAPQDIAYVSFTREGADNGRSRAMKRFGYAKDQFPYFRTLHSMAFQAIGLKRHQVISEKDYRQFSKAMGMNFLGYYTEDLSTGDDKYLFFYEIYRNNPKAAKHYLEELESDKLSYVISGYKQFKRTFALWDYTDMIQEFNRQNLSIPVKVAFIDEAQDLTTIQWLMVKLAFRNCERIYIGGDDDQAIYQWSGADVEYFLGLKGDSEILHKSWRLPNEILEYAKQITDQISRRVPKEYIGTGTVGSVIHVGTVDEVPIRENESYMFLARNNVFLKDVEESLMLKKAIYSIKGVPSISQADVKAIKKYEEIRKERVMSSDDEKMLKPFLKENVRLSDPWYDAFNWSSVKCDYVRDLVAKKATVKDPLIKVGTIHSVKGNEADNVVVLTDITRSVHQNLEDSPDSEHRVFYVGCTRAKKRLYVVSQQHKYGYLLP